MVVSAAINAEIHKASSNEDFNDRTTSSAQKSSGVALTILMGGFGARRCLPVMERSIDASSLRSIVASSDAIEDERLGANLCAKVDR